MKRWASTDIRLTISPTVDELRAELLMTRAWMTRTSQHHQDVNEPTQWFQLITVSLKEVNVGGPSCTQPR